MNIDLHSITSITDPCLLPALRIYEQAFPPYEQMTPSFWIQNLLQLPEGRLGFTAALNREDGDVVGMAFYQVTRPALQPPVAYLWYLCTRDDLRGQGVGAQIYQRLVAQFFEDGIGAVVFEVERPDVAIAHGADSADLAARRIRWYQRNGARLLQNVDYLQHVDNGLQPTPMHLMIHSQQPLTPDEAFRILTEDAGLKAVAIGLLSLD
jgi:GNAT superfamily N-acetyltransferase